MLETFGEELTLREKLSVRCDDLWNVVALLEAASRVTSAGESADEDESNRIRRLVYVAEDQVRQFITAFNDYI